jgi:Beta-ketoacyl synthase, C-terminal domain
VLQVILGALNWAALPASRVDALEMHGTGTPLGDPIEVGAACTVLRGGERPLRFTAAKSRLAHAEAAAGANGMLQVGAGACRVASVRDMECGSITVSAASACNDMECSSTKGGAASACNEASSL